MDCFDRTPASDHGETARRGLPAPGDLDFGPVAWAPEAALAFREGWAPSTQWRVRLKDRVPAEWFELSNSYGAEVTARVLVPLFSLLCLAPYVYTWLGPASLGLLIPAVGTALYKLQFVLHDCSHNSLFRSREWNDRVFAFCGWLAGAHPEVYRHIHMRHHRLNGASIDPQYSDYLADAPVSRGQYIWFVISPLIGGRLLGYMQRELGGLFGGVGRRSQGTAARAAASEAGPRVGLDWVACVVAAQFGIATLATGLWRHPLLALVYPMGAVLIALFLSRVRTIAEHHQPFETKTEDFARSHLPSRLDQFFLYDANFNYHLEHHIFPHLPSNRLGDVNRRLGAEFHDADTLHGSMFGTVFRFLAQLP
ncbi:MAG: fatty acid desaturase [Vicinamibacteria bacterium]|nr:fatty acid desaturase [Vicinamibacteria bacterium]